MLVGWNPVRGKREFPVFRCSGTRDSASIRDAARVELEDVPVRRHRKRVVPDTHMTRSFRPSLTRRLRSRVVPLETRSSSDGPAPVTAHRLSAAGKFLFVGDEKFYVRGVTYGTFRPLQGSDDGWDPKVVEQDFAQVAANGVNTVRTYAVPPRWMLDLASHHRLRVMVGIPWEQHVTFLDERRRSRSIRERVRIGVRACAGHPAVLCYAVGNEIPAPIVRWSGVRRIERFIEQLYRTAKDADPDGLITYVNYPSTEYLQLPFLDLICFNAYLEYREQLRAYVARLQNIAGDRPLMMSEVGLDSRRNGTQLQAAVLDWQVRSTFAAGCAGVIVFAWTDEWHRGGYDIEDWDFGLTDRKRLPKPALAIVRNAFADVPFPPAMRLPRMSVVVCVFNEETTIAQCLENLANLEYPQFEVIVVDDGSTDATWEIAAVFARRHGFRLIRTENRGLSNARNTALAAARGEIVAFLDGDAWPDRHWLTYLAVSFLGGEYVGVGGPNITSPGDGLIADAVAPAPGGPIHVLLSDSEAEHIPGCNMAFRKAALEAVGGFDPQFQIAGDDVDICWRLQRRGWKIGFSPAAVVWHHERSSISEYWNQQRGYGKAEALLEAKWPERYNAACQVKWAGRIYQHGVAQLLGKRCRIYHGTWGRALFQSLYQPAPGVLGSLPTMPEWYLGIFGLAGLALLSVLWSPLGLAIPLLMLAVAASVLRAAVAANKALRTTAPAVERSRLKRLRLLAVTALLHLLQPLARLQGRLEHGLHPWRRHAVKGFAFPWPRTRSIWAARWVSADQRLEEMERHLRKDGHAVLVGGNHDRWDLEIRGGGLGAARLRMVVEEHGAGRQMIRLRSWPRFSWTGPTLISCLAALSAVAAIDGAWSSSGVLGLLALVPSVQLVLQSGAAVSAVLRAFERHEPKADADDPALRARDHERHPRRRLVRPSTVEIPR
jgi:GT2 family glycosyltransferase